MPGRTAPFPEFAFLVESSPSNSPDSIEVFGTFNEIDGLESSVDGLYKVGDVTMKRGVVNSDSLSNWLSAARTNDPSARRDVQVTQRGEGNATVAVWRLAKATPKSFNGSAPGRNGGDLALEELVLSAQQIEKTGPNSVHYP